MKSRQKHHYFSVKTGILECRVNIKHFPEISGVIVVGSTVVLDARESVEVIDGINPFWS